MSGVFWPIVAQVNDLRREIEDAVASVEQMNAALRQDGDDLQGCLVRLEDKPNATDKEALAALVDDREGVGLKLKAALPQIVELWHA